MPFLEPCYLPTFEVSSSQHARRRDAAIVRYATPTLDYWPRGQGPKKKNKLKKRERLAADEQARGMEERGGRSVAFPGPVYMPISARASRTNLGQAQSRDEPPPPSYEALFPPSSFSSSLPPISSSSPLPDSLPAQAHRFYQHHLSSPPFSPTAPAPSSSLSYRPSTASRYSQDSGYESLGSHAPSDAGDQAAEGEARVEGSQQNSAASPQRGRWKTWKRAFSGNGKAPSSAWQDPSSSFDDPILQTQYLAVAYL
ncbi:hypothetical protein JCM10213_009122 [Rhodosporidiobolus nylandii]